MSVPTVSDGCLRKRPLSPREREILELAVRGRSYKQMARELDISKSTVRNHVTDALRKLNVATLREAVALVYGCMCQDCPQRVRPAVAQLSGEIGT